VTGTQIIFRPSSEAVQVQCLNISIIDDSVLEYDTKDFSVHLETSEPLQVLLGVQEAIIVIVDDEGKSIFTSFMSSCI